VKILVLEDNAQRTKIFNRSLIGHEVVVTEFAEEAIKYLNESEWDVLFLDHDLGGKVFVKTVENTGYQVACWLEENPSRKPKTIFLHSLNPDGRKRMKQAIPDAIEAAFGWMVADRLVFADQDGISELLSPFQGKIL
jgi:CheY-like chemotaxis protein